MNLIMKKLKSDIFTILTIHITIKEFKNNKIFISQQLYGNIWKGVTIPHETIFHPRKSAAQTIIITCAVWRNCKLIVIFFETRWLFMQHSFTFANTVSQRLIDAIIWIRIQRLMYLMIISSLMCKQNQVKSYCTCFCNKQHKAIQYEGNRYPIYLFWKI